jgi:hypothetical protein
LDRFQNPIAGRVAVVAGDEVAQLVKNCAGPGITTEATGGCGIGSNHGAVFEGQLLGGLVDDHQRQPLTISRQSSTAGNVLGCLIESRRHDAGHSRLTWHEVLAEMVAGCCVVKGNGVGQ